MRERRVQAVLLRQQLGQVFVVVLHFDFSVSKKGGGGGGGGLGRGTQSVSVQKKRGKKNRKSSGQEKARKVVQLCN